MSELLAGAARPATAAELAGLYSRLHAGGLLPDAVVPAVVVVETPGPGGLAARLPDRVSPYGVEVVALAPDTAGPDRTAFLLGGALHGWCVESENIPADAAPTDTPADGTGTANHSGDAPAGTANDPDPVERQAVLVAAAVADSRLRTWGAAIRPAPVFRRTHRPGSDSTGVVQFTDGGADIVAKIGESGMIRSETGFIARTNGELARIGRDPLFPRLHGVHLEGRQGVSLMEAAEAADLEARLFEDPERTRLGPDAAEILAPYLDQLAGWYRQTAADQPPTSGDYLYRERFHVLREHPDFLTTFRSCFAGHTTNPVPLLDAELLLPDGLRVPGYTAATRWLDEHAASLLPRTGSQVHGDIYPTNMLRRAHGGPVFIDPRTVWEQRARPDVGYGDPVFDLATLLHGLLPMPAVLEAARSERPESLFGPEFDPAVPHDLRSLRLPLAFSGRLRAMEERLVATAPGGEPEHRVRCRLYIGAACSLAGWLKYHKTLRTPQTWLATYAYTAWYLWRARTLHERHEPQGS